MIGQGPTQPHYSPRLGHFLTPDYRAPDIYDPSTFTEPYAYAAGNPIMFWDPDGLDPTSKPFREKGADESQENYVEALIQFLSQKDFITNERDKYPGYTNFDPGSLLFTKITTPRELEYQQLILAFILSGDINYEARKVYSHLETELEGVKGAYLKKRNRWFFANHEIWWTNRFKLSSDGIHITDQTNALTEWTARITNYAGQNNSYDLFRALEGLLVAKGSGLNGGNRNAPGLFPYVARPTQPIGNVQNTSLNIVGSNRVKMSPAHHINTITPKTRFGDGGRAALKIIAKGEVNTKNDLISINSGQFIKIQDNNIIVPSGRIYGLHPHTGNVFLRPNQGTIGLTQAEFRILRNMIESGGLKGNALKMFKGMTNSGNLGLGPSSREILLELFNSRIVEQ